MRHRERPRLRILHMHQGLSRSRSPGTCAPDRERAGRVPERGSQVHAYTSVGFTWHAPVPGPALASDSSARAHASAQASAQTHLSDDQTLARQSLVELIHCD